MDPKFRDDIAVRKRGAATYKAGTWTTTGTTPASIWTPATGRVLRVYRIWLEAYVTTVLAGATAGDYIQVYDNTYANLLGGFYAQNIGSATSTRVAQLGSVVSTTDAITVHYGYCIQDFGTSGVRLAAANNVLKAGPNATITTGVITFRGNVLGIEEDV